ncbi:hypothetical protein HYQ44_017440 [Verticillium longisporum]|nr:hypothetical protein HYQ44_017440 [Verticillium longisporum]
MSLALSNCRRSRLGVHGRLPFARGEARTFGATRGGHKTTINQQKPQFAQALKSRVVIQVQVGSLRQVGRKRNSDLVTELTLPHSPTLPAGGTVNLDGEVVVRALVYTLPATSLRSGRSFRAFRTSVK